MNLPNKLTLIRIIFVIPMMICMRLGYMYIATAIFIVASLTDFIDGKIARKYNLVTDFGKIADPLADKLLVFGALLMFMEKNLVPAWVTMIILTREFLISGLRIVAASKGKVIAASWWGKIKTTLQLIAIPVMMVFPMWKGSTYLIYSATLITAISGVVYIVENRNVAD